MLFLKNKLQPFKSFLNRLNQREQLFLLSSIFILIILIFLGIGGYLHHKITVLEQRLENDTLKLEEVMILKKTYKSRLESEQKRRKKFENNKIRLVNLVEDAAKISGINLGRLQPEKKPVTTEGVVESNVEVQAQNLSIDRLEKFLYELEKRNGHLATIHKLKINKPYRKKTLDVSLKLKTYKLRKIKIKK